MKNLTPRITLLASLVAVITLFSVLLRQDPGSGSADAAVIYELKAKPTQKWYRGNLHTHSLWSDGDDYPEMIADWYQDNGYQFLCYTDHNNIQEADKWIDVEKSKGGREAYDKLKKKYPEGWVVEREKEGRIEVKLKKFDELFKSSQFLKSFCCFVEKRFRIALTNIQST